MYTCLYPAETERDNDEHVVHKLNKALQQRVNKLNERKEAELAAKKKLEKEQGTKNNKKPKFKNVADDIQTASRMQKTEKSLIDHERALHESYQLILMEHRRRMRKRTKHTFKSVDVLNAETDNFTSVDIVKAKTGAVAAFEMNSESETNNIKDNMMKSVAGNTLWNIV